MHADTISYTTAMYKRPIGTSVVLVTQDIQGIPAISRSPSQILKSKFNSLQWNAPNASLIAELHKMGISRALLPLVDIYIALGFDSFCEEDLAMQYSRAQTGYMSNIHTAISVHTYGINNENTFQYWLKGVSIRIWTLLLLTYFAA